MTACCGATSCPPHPPDVQLIKRFRRSAAISRILFPRYRDRSRPRWATTIPLAPASLAGSCDLPGSFGRTALKRLPIRSCSVRGLACHSSYDKRGALLPHLFTLTRPSPCRATAGRYVFCATFLQVTLTGRYPAHCPTEFGLSSPRTRRTERAQRPSGWLRRNVKEPGSSDGPVTLRARSPICLLTDFVLLELLIQVAARCVDDLGRLRDIPPEIAELADEECALTHLLEFTQRSCAVACTT